MTKAPRLNRLVISDAATETMIVCALRFYHSRWVEFTRADGETAFDRMAKPVVKTLTLHVESESNFAAFFLLQRWLFKFGGERLPLTAPDHTAFRLLFLHLYSHPTPPGFIREEYETRWQGIRPGTLEEHAAEVRRALVSTRLARSIARTT